MMWNTGLSKPLIFAVLVLVPILTQQGMVNPIYSALIEAYANECVQKLCKPKKKALPALKLILYEARIKYFLCQLDLLTERDKNIG